MFGQEIGMVRNGTECI
ncbi:unnamed protein product [Tuber melanosporum]|uniref:(Perigord truffle) hypothetical protein n=1 Tax=Tuber melanosporum (strain Mel28) TaxID=656061 RepID=D5GG39_TUBMM|nr:unnamed protein product [Tuber melanosporum]